MRCTAKSKQSGTRCKRNAIAGGTVCNMHGGKAPQVIAKARVRLAALVDPAIKRLEKIIKSGKHDPSAVRAATDVLDRAGLKPADRLELEGSFRVMDPGRDQLSDDDLEKLIVAAKQLRAIEEAN